MSPEVIHERTTKFSTVCEILERYEHKQSMLIPILQAVQDEYHYLPQEVLEFIAASLKIPAAKVYGVATFYAHFALKPKGKYLIRICDGTACHVKESIPILEKIREVLQLRGNQTTTDDLLFTVETVSCLGACGLAPVVVINEKVYACMTPSKIETVLREIITQEKESKA